MANSDLNLMPIARWREIVRARTDGRTRMKALRDAVIQAAEAWRDCFDGIYENALVAAIDELREARK